LAGITLAFEVSGCDLPPDHVLSQHVNLLDDLPAASFAAACDGVMRH
jgi:hypothetical protein